MNKMIEIRHAIARAALIGSNVEINIKDASMIEVDTYKVLAQYAEGIYGPCWRDRVVLTTPTSLNGFGGASLRLHAAHIAGFKTVMLLRGINRFRRANLSWVDSVRGSVIM